MVQVTLNDDAHDRIGSINRPRAGVTAITAFAPRAELLGGGWWVIGQPGNGDAPQHVAIGEILAMRVLALVAEEPK